MKNVRPMYIFTVLASLLAATLFIITHTALNPEVETILTTTSGGLLALLGTVVNFEFGSAKPRDAAMRGSDATVTTGVETTTAETTTVKSTEPKP